MYVIAYLLKEKLLGLGGILEKLSDIYTRPKVFGEIMFRSSDVSELLSRVFSSLTILYSY
jgi:hypothetical protein